MSIAYLTGKREFFLTTRCNESLKIAVTSAKELTNRNTLLIQEEGGWLTYEKLAKTNGLKLIKLKIHEGKIDLFELQKHPKSILLMHSMPGYSFKENMEEIQQICKKKNIFLINDCCGSVGTNDAKIGDIIVCSFGKAKPLSSVGGGGFLATNKKIAEHIIKKHEVKIKNSILFLGDAYKKLNLESIEEAITMLNPKVTYWKKISNNVKKDLEPNIINKGNQGLNVLLSYKNNKEKEKLIKYCLDNKLEFTQCPRYIRTNQDALSVEIKRIEFSRRTRLERL